MKKKIFITILISVFSILRIHAQFMQQGPKLVGTGNSGNSEQGVSVAISSDGNTAIIGAPLDNNSAGAVWIFTRSGNVWSQQGTKLVGTGAIGNSQQGISVALSSDGSTAIVGGNTDNAVKGAIWIFTRSGGVWTQQGPKLVGTGGVGNPGQGYSVSLSSDGNTAIVGGASDSSGTGAMWVFTRSVGVWTQQGNKLKGSGFIGLSHQGISVSLSADGNTAITGGNLDNNFIGASWVFVRNGTMWTQQGNKLVGTGNSGIGDQGYSVSISADGNTALVGAPADNTLAGALWIFTRNSGVWTQQGTKVTGTGEVGGSQLGFSVALSPDGNTAIAGGPIDNNDSGAVWIFNRNGDTWTQKNSKLTGTGAVGASNLGVSVCLSPDGTLLAGGGNDNNLLGATWVFYNPLFGISPISSEIPKQFSLSQNYPNPFNPNTIIKFQIKDSRFTELKVYDAIGREAANLVNEELKAGTYEINFDGTKYASGVYFYKLIVGGNNGNPGFSETKKMLMIK